MCGSCCGYDGASRVPNQNCCPTFANMQNIVNMCSQRAGPNANDSRNLCGQTRRFRIFPSKNAEPGEAASRSNDPWTNTTVGWGPPQRRHVGGLESDLRHKPLRIFVFYDTRATRSSDMVRFWNRDQRISQPNRTDWLSPDLILTMGPRRIAASRFLGICVKRKKHCSNQR